ncbi:unnamed protein product [Heligmosomoides polygyrus]|uniref:RING-type E3 ubiquitin transferase n=1 Tax=Heligmosomoides polygyrus TaxID=6339 RepID=A0A183F1W9_HELPZ|nr:unnamed protein product [Heligmosomoides polygyrus]
MYSYIINGLPQIIVGIKHTIAAEQFGFKKQIGPYCMVTHFPDPICALPHMCIVHPVSCLGTLFAIRKHKPRNYLWHATTATEMRRYASFEEKEEDEQELESITSSESELEEHTELASDDSDSEIDAT